MLMLWDNEKSAITINMQSQGLLAALVGFMQPIIHASCSTSDSSESQSMSARPHIRPDSDVPSGPHSKEPDYPFVRLPEVTDEGHKLLRAFEEFIVSIVQPRTMPITEPKIPIAKTVSERDEQPGCSAPISKAVALSSPPPPPLMRRSARSYCQHTAPACFQRNAYSHVIIRLEWV
ncbi:hypothetical protein HYPSUDRAFT_574673 [Hypholoma sublateritium FD-334 SS-4]|uniref:Uncharacterized protein n=1 Tax=Hypholoma sublateritium (strain FD-334 SS-4) TaxID=945553 RepID=A0A0D2L999_HYPSF|nr:hypothetical protein HYPSUDRAFT_574673 [Hypholoma sublateritium FD-334 SS-4]